MIAQIATTTLSPFFPYLIKMGDKAAEEVAKKIGGEAWDNAKNLWAKIRPRVEAAPSAKEALSDAASMPDDRDAQAAFRLQLKKLLSQEPDFAREIEAMVSERRQADVSVVVSGERAVGIGGDMSGGTIHTGDSLKP